MSRTVFFIIVGTGCLIAFIAPLAAQEAVDTTLADYQIGYRIGSWLPFLVLAFLFILMLRAAMKRQDAGPKI